MYTHQVKFQLLRWNAKAIGDRNRQTDRQTDRQKDKLLTSCEGLQQIVDEEGRACVGKVHQGMQDDREARRFHSCYCCFYYVMVSNLYNINDRILCIIIIIIIRRRRRRERLREEREGEVHTLHTFLCPNQFSCSPCQPTHLSLVVPEPGHSKLHKHSLS